MKFFHFCLVILLISGAYFWADRSIATARQEAISLASEHLKLIRDIRIAQLKGEIKTIYSEIRFWAESKPLSDGMEQMLVAWDDLSFDPKKKARQLYITDNPLYPNYTADFYKADDGSLYSESHQKIHTLLKGLTQRRGYYDVFLIAKNGDVIYSVYKEDDYATNLLSGKYKETTLAQGFREVMDNTNLNHVSLFDFIPYAPSNNAPSSFIQTSIVDSNHKTQGLLAFQLPSESIDKIIENTAGLGESTEIMAVGSDYLLRNRINKTIIKEERTSIAIDNALKEKSGVEQLQDYKGVTTITAYAPFEFSQNVLGSTNKNTWAIIVKQDLVEVLKPVEEKIKKGLILLSGLTLISLLFSWLITRGKEDLSTTED